MTTHKAAHRYVGSLANYTPMADADYRQLTKDQKERWSMRAAYLRTTELGIRFKAADRAVKRMPPHLTDEDVTALLRSRERVCRELARECGDLPLEIVPANDLVCVYDIE